jgi:hypothetical protein
MAWHVVAHTVDGKEHRFEPWGSEDEASTHMHRLAEMAKDPETILSVDFPEHGRKLLLPNGVAWIEIKEYI